MTAALRPMTSADAAGVVALIGAAIDDLNARQGRPAEAEHPPQVAERWRRIVASFPSTDPDGAVVAEDDAGLAGVAVAVRREAFWGLSLLFVRVDGQGAGLGRRLLDAVLPTRAGAAVQAVSSSEDPKAMRRYAALGLRLHPTVAAVGKVDRSGLPAPASGLRDGGTDDLDLVDAVDRTLREGSRAPDVERFLAEDGRLHVLADGRGHGYALTRDRGLRWLGATDAGVARDLLVAVLAEAGPDDEVELEHLTSTTDWAVDVALAARLSLQPRGPLFLAGRDLPPAGWLPNGVFF